jgi:hypothetical protein
MSQTAESAVRRHLETKSRFNASSGEGKRLRNTMETTPSMQTSSNFISPLAPFRLSSTIYRRMDGEGATSLDRGNVHKVA